MKIDILAIGAHPDDVELSCSGTLLKHISLGKTVGLVDLTRGELGTRGSAEIRDEEAKNAALLMGAKFRDNLLMEDGFFQHEKTNLLKIMKVIRKYQPEIVLANAPEDRHPDHGKAAKLIVEACFLSGLIKIQTQDENGNIQPKWRPKVVYHYIQDFALKPDFVVDITPFINKKFEVIKAFRSQFHVPEATEYKQELKSPISGKDFMEYLRGRAISHGRPAGFEYGEGFIVNRTIGVQNLFDLR